MNPPLLIPSAAVVAKEITLAVLPASEVAPTCKIPLFNIPRLFKRVPSLLLPAKELFTSSCQPCVQRPTGKPSQVNIISLIFTKVSSLAIDGLLGKKQDILYRR